MRETIYIPSQIRNDYESFSFFIESLHKVSCLKDSEIIFNFVNTTWFDANLTAILGCLFSKGFVNNNKLYVNNVNNGIEQIFKKNNFYESCGLGSDIDRYNSTIKYKIFKSENRTGFSDYVKRELIPKITINMSEGFKKNLRLALEELFQNARTHGKCDFIFTCGQYYPRKENVKFTIIDLGSTIHENVKLFLKDDNISSIEAIDWATVEGNSTRDRGETGGIGLFLIRDFLKKNDGKIQIISSDGYWEENCGNNQKRFFHNKFLGTIVNIEVNINDYNTYITKEEEKNKFIENIF